MIIFLYQSQRLRTTIKETVFANFHYLLKDKFNTTCTYFVKFFPSSIVSGNCLFRVSGRVNVKPAATNEAAPNMTNGIALPEVPPIKSA